MSNQPEKQQTSKLPRGEKSRRQFLEKLYDNLRDSLDPEKAKDLLRKEFALVVWQKNPEYGDDWEGRSDSCTRRAVVRNLRLLSVAVAQGDQLPAVKKMMADRKRMREKLAALRERYDREAKRITHIES